MAPAIGAALIGLGSTVFGGLFGNKKPQTQSTVTWDIDLIEQQKDNTALYGILGVGFIVLLLITAYFILRKRQ